jgi:hypothetical protein
MCHTGSAVISEHNSQDNSVDPTAQEPEALVVESGEFSRGANGRFIAGKSGNPLGRPPTARYNIQSLQQEIEFKIRRKFTVETIVSVIQKTFEAALGSGKEATQNRKLIFDYFLSKPKEAVAQEAESGSSVTIKIENATFKATHEPKVIEGEVTEVH